MDEVLRVNQNGDLLEEIEKLRFSRYTEASREDRRDNRLNALTLLDGLIDEYGSITDVPDGNLLLHEARVLLGAFSGEIVDTNVAHLRSRIKRLSVRHDLSFEWFYNILGYYLSLNPTTVKYKIYANRFTKSECTMLWGQWELLERVENLKCIEHMYQQSSWKTSTRLKNVGIVGSLNYSM